MCEFTNLLNTIATHLTADNIESFIKLTEHLIALGQSVSAGNSTPVAAVVDVLSTVGSVIENKAVSPSNV